MVRMDANDVCPVRDRHDPDWLRLAQAVPVGTNIIK